MVDSVIAYGFKVLLNIEKNPPQSPFAKGGGMSSFETRFTPSFVKEGWGGFLYALSL
jgi:hypothetical protein